ncbi:MAG: hypothetical protein FWH37_05225 [Candidatus Bathyarchaeota archaeon]|nr:hypothetical protein [Candidatus Termiticorpusculum sp.]
MVIDFHSDLSILVLSYISCEKWVRVVYINSWSVFEDKYGYQVLQINFLESKDSMNEA